MASAGDPLQGQARPGQAYWPPSRVTASAVTTAASSSLEAAAPLKADLRHVFRMHARVRPGQASGAAGGGGFLQWPRNRGLHLQQGQAGRTGGTATSDGMKPGHGKPPQPSRPRRRSVLWGS
ncbi:uncharacterized protein [Aegilops tauschii subsp. strangulata]|uniref:uncharacterized protein n=1 Tax=Aegilops tauschii subsp. strangulata TaxID=200361 RepID=UPI003CC8E17F